MDLCLCSPWKWLIVEVKILIESDDNYLSCFSWYLSSPSLNSIFNFFCSREKRGKQLVSGLFVTKLFVSVFFHHLVVLDCNSSVKWSARALARQFRQLINKCTLARPLSLVDMHKSKEKLDIKQKWDKFFQYDFVKANCAFCKTFWSWFALPNVESLAL